MRIFHNKSTHQVIIITTDLAYSFYCYTQDNPITAAKDYLNTEDGLKSFASACEEIKLPETDKTEESIQKGINMAKKELKEHKTTQENKPCEHSQKKNKKP